MIRRWGNLKFYRADCYLSDSGRKLTAVMPTKHEAWQALIEIVAIEARNQ